MSNIKYRPEVDGLRALAVLSVVFFHAGLGFPGGYVGVDIFFVISGFLITSILLRDIEQDRFSFKDFCCRRIRRIVPTAFVVVFVTLCIGAYLLTPKDFRSLGKSSLFYSFMMANVHFWKDIGYFTASADYKPLLHTWSLAVEEQFYIIFPSLLLWLKKSKSLSVKKALGFIFLSSFVLGLIGVKYFPSASFYLLPTRAWELLAGSLLACYLPRMNLKKWQSELGSIMGLFFMLLSIFIYEKSTPFPSFYTVLPVLGAVLFIGSTYKAKTLVSRLFSLKPIVYVGLVSYSFYLWHWPVLVYAKFVLVETTPAIQLGLCLLSFLLACISYYLVEQPFRKYKIWSEQRKVWQLGGVLSIVTILCSLVIYKGDGLPARFSSSLVMEDVKWNGSAYIFDGEEPVTLGKTDEKSIDYLFLGDSHAMALSETVDKASKDAGLKGLSAIKDSLTPTPYLSCVSFTEEENLEHRLFNEKAIDLIKKHQIKNVILAFRWGVRVAKYSEAEIESGHEAYGSLSFLKEMTPLEKLGVSEAKESMKKALERYSALLSTMGVKLYLIRQVPVLSKPYPARDFIKISRFPSLNKSSSARALDLAEFRVQGQAMSEVLAGLENSNVEIVDPATAFFPDSDKPMNWHGERSYYRDDDHLTRYGAEIFMKPLLSKIFLGMKK